MYIYIKTSNFIIYKVYLNRKKEEEIIIVRFYLNHYQLLLQRYLIHRINVNKAPIHYQLLFVLVLMIYLHHLLLILYDYLK